MSLQQIHIEELKPGDRVVWETPRSEDQEGEVHMFFKLYEVENVYAHTGQIFLEDGRELEPKNGTVIIYNT